MAGTLKDDWSIKRLKKGEMSPAHGGIDNETSVVAEEDVEYGRADRDYRQTEGLVGSEANLAFENKSSWVLIEDENESPAEYLSVLSNLLRDGHCYFDRLTVEGVRHVLDEGFKKSEYNRLKNLLSVSETDLARVIRIPTRTLARREKFKPDESERILRVARVFHRCLVVMEEIVRAREWFKTPKRALGEKTPFEFCDSEIGANEVLNLLGRIEHGVFS